MGRKTKQEVITENKIIISHFNCVILDKKFHLSEPEFSQDIVWKTLAQVGVANSVGPE